MVKTRKDAINVLEHPGEHLKITTFKDGRQEIIYSADLVKTFEIAIENLKLAEESAISETKSNS